ncbi:hypothetical protein ALQ64_05185 [Pseudomonas cannabina]|uniref:Uncharacterized protein n=1 Tax=Pseudomonas cannabina TaxID=86840 RepID=A0A3M3KZF6_PSECA|nr:hypothetical protein ALQ64_05185 [Pseudomonas cannabina]
MRDALRHRFCAAPRSQGFAGPSCPILTLPESRQRRQQLLVDGLADGGEEGGAAGQELFYHAAQGGGAFCVEAAYRLCACLFGCGAAWRFEPQSSELAKQVFLVNQVRVHHGVCSCDRAFFRFW